MKALSIGRRFLALNSGSFFLRSARVGEPAPELRMPLRRQSGAQCAGGNAVDHERPLATQVADVSCCREAVVRPLRDRGIVVAVLGRAAVAFHVDAPAVEAAAL